MRFQLLHSSNVIPSGVEIMACIDSSFVLGQAYCRSLINIIHVDDAITQGWCSLEPQTTPTEDQGNEGFPPAHPLTAPGQERRIKPAPAAALPCLLVATSPGNVLWLRRLSLDSTNLSPVWEFFAGDPCNGSPQASTRTEANGSSQELPNISSHAQAYSPGRTLSSEVRNSCPKDLHSTQGLKLPDNNVYNNVYKRHEFWRKQAAFV